MKRCDLSPTGMRRNSGNTSVVVIFLVLAATVILQAAMQLTLGAYTLATAWDIRRQRDIEARAVAAATKEAILTAIETAPTTTTSTLSAAIDTQLATVTTGTSGITLSQGAGNSSITLPNNAQWPTGVLPALSVPDFTALSGIGRNLQSLLSAGRIADLGTFNFTFTESNAKYPGETATYGVTTRIFSAPITNFNWIAYGLPSTGVPSSPPANPSWSQGATLRALTANGYSGEAGSFPEMFVSSSTTLPYAYREQASACWNIFEYWTGIAYQNALRTAAGTANIFDFSSPGTPPSGVTWDGTTATVNLAATSSSVLVFVDSLGGSNLNIVGSGTTGTPVVIAVRNFSGVQTNVTLTGNNSRTVMLYLPNSNVGASSAGISVRAALLLFPNSSVSGAAFNIYGFVGYPMSWATPPGVQCFDDSQAKTDLESVAPRAVFVSTRGTIQ